MSNDITKHLNIDYNKQLELVLGIHAAYKRQHPELSSKLDWIECPDVTYVNELINLIDIDNQKELCTYIKYAFDDCAMAPNIAINMNKEYEFIGDLKEQRSLKYGTVSEFCYLIKELSLKINWDTFFAEHDSYHQELLNEFNKFPENLDLKDINKFYNSKEKSYHYIPSILMNGGFGFHDDKNNLYYLRGIQYNEKNKQFEFDQEYLLECLFHEYSHSFVNPLVDKYFTKFESNKIYQTALKHNLHYAYQNPKTLLYEYIVRCNANVLTRKYYSNPYLDFHKELGFISIEELIEYTINNRYKYETYEEFFQKGLIHFMNSMVKEETLSSYIQKNR